MSLSLKPLTFKAANEFVFLLSVDIEVWSMLKRAVGEPGAVQLFNEVLKRGDGDTNNSKKKGSGWLH